VHRMEDYAELIGYLHSSDLRWSYGQLKGRPSKWEAAVARRPPAQMLAELSALGFDGIYLDTFGYAHRGRALIPELSRVLGVTPLVSADGRLYFFDMARYNRRLRERRSR
jgi:phosphoglycerol transferase